ncbi:hypothetical protein JXB12_00555 [candidate division KSB1 bacterium]|nr:hypothetical protein [candidate division KSB1 bacterium]
MALSVSTDHRISLEEAKQLMRNYTAQAVSPVKGGFFSRDALIELLDQQKCIGLRYYYGTDDDGTPTLVLVGVDEQEDDMAGIILEKSIPTSQDFLNE